MFPLPILLYEAKRKAKKEINYSFNVHVYVCTFRNYKGFIVPWQLVKSMSKELYIAKYLEFFRGKRFNDLKEFKIFEEKLEVHRMLHKFICSNRENLKLFYIAYKVN